MKLILDQEVFQENTLDSIKLGELVGLVYRGAQENPPWISLLTKLRDILNSYPIALIIRPASPNQRAFVVVARKNDHGLGREDSGRYGCFTPDIFSKLKEDQMVCADSFLGEKAWINSDFFRTWVEPLDIRYMLAAQIRGTDGSLCRLRVCRPLISEKFSERELAICQALIPHFKHALSIYSHMNALELEKQFYSEALDRLLIGTVLLDSNGNVFRMNEIAEEIVAAGDGLSFSADGLSASDPHTHRLFRSKVSKALKAVSGDNPYVRDDFSGVLYVPRSKNRFPLSIKVFPLPFEEDVAEKKRLAVALLINDPERKSRRGRELLGQRYGLTPTESTLAQLIAEGNSLDQAAIMLGVKKNTVRVHLASIFAKTGTQRQSSLVSLFINGVERQL